MNRRTAYERYMKLPLNELVKIADKEFQKMRRMEEADEHGMVVCICCPNSKPKHYSEVDGGHFIQRQHLGTRYDPRNVWPQRKYCNDYRSGNHAAYRDALIEKIGLDQVEEMERNKRNTPDNWREFVINVIINSRERIKELSC